ncbi:MAG: FG-GAP-like repeat-containing protein [Myxococcota bacterium]
MFGLALGGACGDGGKRPLGATCSDDATCESGLCAEGVCLDPAADDDHDNLTNGLEASLGSNPENPDTDGDGVPDGEELDGALANVDTDGDGKADVVESRTEDADHDCITDQFDAEDTVPNSDLSPMIPIVCSHVGVCAGADGQLGATCPSGTAECVYTGVTGFADPEAACDGVDENCDGDTDEGFGDGDHDGVPDACVARHHLVFQAQPTTVTAGVPFDPLALLDLRGAVVTTFNGEVTLALEPVDAGTITYGEVTRAGGAITIHGVTLTKAGDERVLVASAGLFTARSEPLVVGHSGTLALAFDTVPDSAMVGVPFDASFLVHDEYDNIADDFAGVVTLASDDPDATLPGPITLAAAHHGRGTFFGVSLANAGTTRLTISADGVGVAPASHDVVVAAGAVTSLGISGLADTVDAGVSLSLTVTALDAAGNAVADYDGTVSISADDPDASMPASHVYVGADHGAFTFTGLVFATAGTATVTASDGVRQAQAVVTVRPGAAHDFEVVLSDESVPAGVATSAVITALDVRGNRATGFVGAVTLSSGDALATLPGGVTFAAADAGRKVVNGIIFRSEGTQSLTVTATADASVTGSDAGRDPGRRHGAGHDRPARDGGVGRSLGFTVEAQDSFGNPKPAYAGTVRVSADDAAAVLPADATFAPADGASKAFAGLVLKTARETIVRVTDIADPTITTSAIVSVTAGARDHFSFACSPDPLAAGSALTCTATAFDAAGNVASGYVGNLALSATDPDATLPASVAMVAADHGTKTFSGVVLETAGSQTVTIDDGVKSASDTVTVTPVAASSLELAGLAASVGVGEAQTLTATLRDPFGNRATAFTGSATLASNDLDAVFAPTALTFDAAAQGQRTFTVTFGNAGDRTVTVDAGGTLKTTKSTVVTGGTRHLAITGLPANLVAGATSTVTVSVRNGAGQLVTNYAGTVALTVTGGSASPTTLVFVAANGGSKTADVTFTLAGADDLTASSADLGSTTVNTTVAPAAGESLAFGPQPSGGQANVALADFAVVVRDHFGNIASSDSERSIGVALTRNPGRARITGTTSVATVGARATFHALSLDRAAQGYQLVATAPGLAPAVSEPFAIAWRPPVVSNIRIAAENGACVTITYRVAQPDGRPVDVAVERATGFPAQPFERLSQAGNATAAGTRVATSAAGVDHDFVWNASGDAHFADFAFQPGNIRVSASVDGSVGRATNPAPFSVLLASHPTIKPVPVTVTSPRPFLRTGDVDGDGDDDLIVAGGDDAFAIYRRSAAGLVGRDDTLGVDASLPPVIEDALVADLDEQPGGDLAFLDSANGTVWVSRLNVDGVLTFRDLSPCSGLPATAIAAGAFGYGGDSLLVACTGDGDVFGIWSLRLGEFVLESMVDLGAKARLMRAVDLDRNGFADVVVATAAGLEVALTDVDQVTARAQTLPLARPVVDLDLLDIDDDFHPDLVVVQDDLTSHVFAGVAGGTFATTALATNTAYPGAELERVDHMDVDRDGLPDIVVAQKDSPYVFYRLGQRAATPVLGPQGAALATGSDSLAVVDLGAVARDGERDQLAALYRDGGAYELALWQPNDAICQIDPIGPAPTLALDRSLQLEAGDFTADGKLDLLSVAPTGLWISLGLGDGGFARYGLEAGALVPFTSLVTGAIAEVTGDGQPDVVVALDDGQVIALRVDPPSLSVLPTIASYGSAVAAMAGADVDGDRRDDLVLAESIDKLHVLYQGASGGFPGGGDETFDVGAPITGLDVADVNLDGVLDMAIAVQDDSGGPGAYRRDVCVFMSTGARAHTMACADVGLAAAGADASIVGPRLADVDQDGFTDLVYALVPTDLQTPSQLVVATATAPLSGVFDQRAAVDACPDLERFALGALDDQPGLDLAATCALDGAVVTLARGPAGFDFADAISTFVGPSVDGGLALGDFDGDGRDDVAIDEAVLHTGSPGPVLDQSVAVSFGGESWLDATPLDWNGDASTDFALVSGVTYDTGDGDATDLVLTLTDGLGEKQTWSYTATYPSSSNFMARVAAGDFDGDGRADLALFYGVSSSRAELRMVYRPNDDADSLDPEGTFAQPLRSGLSPVALAAGDVDGDGLDDVAAFGVGSSNLTELRWVRALPDRQTEVYRAENVEGLPTRVDQVLIGDLVPGRPGKEIVVVGNCGGDGCIEAFEPSSCSGQRPACMRSTVGIGGSFNQGHYDFHRAALVDYDRDGLTDVIVTVSPDDHLMLMHQLASGGFEPKDDFPSTYGMTYPSFAVADLDDDGRVDLVVPTLRSGRLALHAVMGDGSIEPAGSVEDVLPLGVLAARAGLGARPALVVPTLDGLRAVPQRSPP